MEIVNQEIQGISGDEVKAAIKRMKSGKAVGPDTSGGIEMLRRGGNNVIYPGCLIKPWKDGKSWEKSCGTVQRRDAGYVGRRVLRMEPSGRRR